MAARGDRLGAAAWGGRRCVRADRGGDQPAGARADCEARGRRAGPRGPAGRRRGPFAHPILRYPNKRHMDARFRADRCFRKGPARASGFHVQRLGPEICGGSRQSRDLETGRAESVREDALESAGDGAGRRQRGRRRRGNRPDDRGVSAFPEPKPAFDPCEDRAEAGTVAGRGPDFVAASWRAGRR